MTDRDIWPPVAGHNPPEGCETSMEPTAPDLLNEYLMDVAADRPAATGFLRRAGPGQAPALEAALGTLNALVDQVAAPPVSEASLCRMIDFMARTNARKERLSRMRERFRALFQPAATVQSPVPFLRTVMGLPDHRRVTALARQASAAPARLSPDAGAEAIWEARRRDAALERRILADVETVLPDDLTAPPDADRIAETLGVFVGFVPLDGLEGCLVTDGEGGAILINDRMPDARRRQFTLAHEIGHFVLHKDVGEFRDTEADLGCYRPGREQEANLFAAGLLMPERLLAEHIGAGAPTLAVADAVSARFDVSLSAAIRRLIRASPLACALIVTQDGLIHHYAASPTFLGHVSTKRPPAPGTAAASVLTPGAPAEVACNVPASAWVTRGPLQRDDVIVREESRRMDDRFVYTLVHLATAPNGA